MTNANADPMPTSDPNPAVDPTRRAAPVDREEPASMPDENAVVITGCGWVTPFAIGSVTDVLLEAETAGCHGSVSSGPSPQAEGTPAGLKQQEHPPGTAWTVPEQCVTEYPDLAKELKRDKGAWIAALAWKHAVRTATLDISSLDPGRVGLVLGCSLAGQLGMINFAGDVRKQSPRFVSPIRFPQTVGNYIAGALARGFGIRGVNVTLASGPSSALHSLIEACRLIHRGEADVVLAGGVEQWSQELASALADPDVPVSEGACLLVLERATHAARRGAQPLATVLRWGSYTPRAAGFSLREHTAPGDTPRHAAPGITPAEPSAPDTVSAPTLLSAAAGSAPGIILIERWIGRCPGAAGAAAVAAAIGAANSHAVPILDESSPDSVCATRISFDELRASDGTITAGIVANAARREDLSLELAFPPAPRTS